MSEGVVVIGADEVEFEGFDEFGADLGGGHKQKPGNGRERTQRAQRNALFSGVECMVDSGAEFAQVLWRGIVHGSHKPINFR